MSEAEARRGHRSRFSRGHSDAGAGASAQFTTVPATPYCTASCNLVLGVEVLTSEPWEVGLLLGVEERLTHTRRTVGGRSWQWQGEVTEIPGDSVP